MGSLPGSRALKPMPQAQIAQGVQLLDLMLEYFSDARHWARGHYDDGNGGHCLVGALLNLSRKHHLPRAPATAPDRHARRCPKGTGGSNPLSSSAESSANLSFRAFTEAEKPAGQEKGIQRQIGGREYEAEADPSADNRADD